MRKQIGQKRKLKNFTHKLLIYCSLFFTTLLILFSWYLWNLHFKKKLLSPLPIVNASRQTMLNTEDTSHIAALVQKLGISVVSVDAQSDSFLLSTNNNQQIILSKKKDITQQLASLQLIMNRLTIEGRKFIKIDFRFDNPVVNY